MAHKPPSLKITILSPQTTLVDGFFSMATLPGESGQFSVLDRHEPFATSLKSGLIELFDEKNQVKTLKITRGFAHVNPSIGCLVLLEEVPASAINV